MKIEVQKLTGLELLRESNSMVTGKQSNMTLLQCYRALHSNARTQIFWIKMFDIKLSAASHFVRHVHAQPFQRSKRPDRDPNAKDLGRNTPTDLGLLVNSEEIVNISVKRLCQHAAVETRHIWEQVLNAIEEVDPDLVKFCKKPCVLQGYCRESKPCGYMASDSYRFQRKTFKNLFKPKV